MDTNKEIRRHLIYLRENLTNLFGILLYLVQNDIISNNEVKEIDSAETTARRNAKLLDILQRKQLPFQTFLLILRNTKNEHCANAIERTSRRIIKKNEGVPEPKKYTAVSIPSAPPLNTENNYANENTYEVDYESFYTAVCNVEKIQNVHSDIEDLPVAENVGFVPTPPPPPKETKNVPVQIKQPAVAIERIDAKPQNENSDPLKEIAAKILNKEFALKQPRKSNSPVEEDHKDTPTSPNAQKVTLRDRKPAERGNANILNVSPSSELERKLSQRLSRLENNETAMPMPYNKPELNTHIKSNITENRKVEEEKLVHQARIGNDANITTNDAQVVNKPKVPIKNIKTYVPAQQNAAVVVPKLPHPVAHRESVKADIESDDDVEDSYYSDLVHEIEIMELTLKREQIARRVRNRKEGIIDDEPGESELDIEIKLKKLKYEKNKLEKKSKATLKRSKPQKSEPEDFDNISNTREQLNENPVPVFVAAFTQNIEKQLSVSEPSSPSLPRNIVRSPSSPLRKDNVNFRKSVGKSQDNSAFELQAALNKRRSHIETGQDAISEKFKGLNFIKPQEKTVHKENIEQGPVEGAKINRINSNRNSGENTFKNGIMNRNEEEKLKVHENSFPKSRLYPNVQEMFGNDEKSESNIYYKEKIVPKKKVTEENVTFVPPPPPPPPISNGGASGGTNNDKSPIARVPASLLAEIQKGDNKLRPINSDLKNQKKDARGKKDDLHAVLAKVINSRNIKMNPDNANGGDSSDEEQEWDSIKRPN